LVDVVSVVEVKVKVEVTFAGKAVEATTIVYL
jgi:hypothetical protein